MIKYYIPVNKIGIQVPYEMYKNFPTIIYGSRRGVTFIGRGYGTHYDEGPMCFVVYTVLRDQYRFNTYEEAELKFKRLTDGILCVH